MLRFASFCLCLLLGEKREEAKEARTQKDAQRSKKKQEEAKKSKKKDKANAGQNGDDNSSGKIKMIMTDGTQNCVKRDVGLSVTANVVAIKWWT